MINRNEARKELIERAKRELAVRKAREHLLPFIKLNHRNYVTGWFNRELCLIMEEFLQDVFSGKKPRILIEAPPRSGKSEVVSRNFPAWALGISPDLEIINTSYSADLASTFNKAAQMIIDSETYHEIFPDTMIQGQIVKSLKMPAILTYKKTSEEFMVIGHHGRMFSSGVGGGITGRGADIFIIDDPFKNREEADSETQRQKVWEWYTSTALTRLSDCGGMIIMNTRWHIDDLTGRLLQKMAEGSGQYFKRYRFPAIAEEDEPYRKAGEALQPERYSLETLQGIQKAIGSKDWAALYQQNPIPDGGGMFKENWIQYYSVLPTGYTKAVMSWDMTFKDSKTSDFVCGQVWIQYQADFYLVDQIRGRFDFVTTVEKFVMFAQKHSYCHRKLIEDKANGTAIINMLKKRISGIVPVIPHESKEARANAVTTYWEAHNVYIPDPKTHKWVELEFTPELLSFPGGKHDDQVDCMSQALNDLTSRNNTIDPSNILALMKEFH